MTQPSPETTSTHPASPAHPANVSSVQFAGVGHLDGFDRSSWTITSSQSTIYSDTWVWSRGRVFHSVFLRKCSFVIGCDALLTSALWNCATNTLETHQHEHQVHGVAPNYIRLIQNICNLRFIKYLLLSNCINLFDFNWGCCFYPCFTERRCHCHFMHADLLF